MEYELGKIYDFDVKSIKRNRIYLEDKDGGHFSVPGFDFQTEWDAASTQVPMRLRCYVKDIESDEALRLQQSKLDVLKRLYPEADKGQAKEYPFVIKSLMQTQAGEQLFIVCDAFGLTHTYKPTDEQKSLQPGDEIKLTVFKIMEKADNRSCLLFQPKQNEGAEPTAQVAEAANKADNETTVGEFGVEDDTLEFKSTIVYPASAPGADIDTQIQVIVKTVAGFMNAKGGTLFIGVDDNGKAVGIEDEYKLLNSSTKDKYHYKEDANGYEAKIMCAIKYYLSAVAIDYIKIAFSKHSEHTICTIEVEPSNSVIWFNKREAYKRLGNSTIHLRSTLIEKLVLDKSKVRPADYQVKPILVEDEDEVLQEADEELYDMADDTAGVKQAAPATLKNIGDERKGKGSFYMNMFSDGKWSWSMDIPNDADLEFCIPINSPAGKQNLILVYEDGCVNRIDAYHLRLDYKKNEATRFSGRIDGVKLVKAFAAKDDDMLACFCMLDGHENVKVHHVSDISKHKKMDSKPIILINKGQNPGVTDANVYFVSAIHNQRISALVKTANQTSTSLGCQIDSDLAKYLRIRDTLKSVCDVLVDDNN